MTAITTLRSTLATALVDNTRWQVFSFPPATPIANSVIIQPDDPYIVPSNNNNNIAPLANFKVIVIVPMFDNQGNLSGIEDHVVAVFSKLAASNLKLNIGSVSAPSVMSTVAGEMLSSEIAISILTTWS